MSLLLRSHSWLSARGEHRPSSDCRLWMHLPLPPQGLCFSVDFLYYLSNGSSSHIYKFVSLFFSFHFLTSKMKAPGTSLAVWWLRPRFHCRR